MKKLFLLTLAAFALCACDESATGAPDTTPVTPSSSSAVDIPASSGAVPVDSAKLYSCVELSAEIPQLPDAFETCKHYAKLLDDIRMESEGTAFCIRYMGCPDSSIVQRQSIYVPECEYAITCRGTSEECNACVDKAKANQTLGADIPEVICHAVVSQCER